MIKLGVSFEYVLLTFLKIKRGTMEGFYRFVVVDVEEVLCVEFVMMDFVCEDDFSVFNVEIGVFGLFEFVMF